MKYKVVFIPEAVNDYKRLDGSVKKVINKKIDALEENPYLGERLGNKFNVDLSGFNKIYAAKKNHRIVYRLLSPDRLEIVEIWGIGKRDKEEIYRLIAHRLKKKE